jgi:hypothetical protein
VGQENEAVAIPEHDVAGEEHQRQHQEEPVADHHQQTDSEQHTGGDGDQLEDIKEYPIQLRKRKKRG